MDSVSSLLNEITEAVDRDDLAAVPGRISAYIGAHPEAYDDRFKSEMLMIEKMMDYKSNLKDWAYFRTMKLVYQYVSMQYASKLPDRSANASAGGLSGGNATTAQTLLPDHDTIWCCWLQGEEQAPAVVKKCLDSLKRFGRKIVVLTNDNFTDYTDIPEHVLEKKRQGIINNTHFTDILRADLLSKRGGTWIDATVYVSDPSLMSEVMGRYSLFAYSFAMRDSISDSMLFDSWFLHCTSVNPVICDVRDMLYEYWRNEDSLMHYFLFHLMFSIACRRHPEINDSIPVFSLEPCHLLQHEMLKPYDELRWKHIMLGSGIHKLTYKYDTSADIRGTMLEHLLEA